MNDEISDSDLKIELNTLIWMHMPEEMTLGEADALSCKMFDAWEDARAKVRNRVDAKNRGVRS